MVDRRFWGILTRIFLADTPPDTGLPDFETLAEQTASGLAKAHFGTGFWGDFGRMSIGIVAGLVGFLLSIVTLVAAWLAQLMVKALKVARPEIDQLAGAAFEELFGRSVIGAGTAGSDPAAAAAALGKGVIAALVSSSGGPSGDGITPSSAPGEQFIGSNVELALRGWILDLGGQIETLGQVQIFNHLVDDTVQALGIGRLTSRALRPAIDILIAQPMAQQFNESYRPQLLSEGLAAKAVIRGTKDYSWLETELGRAGYSSDRIVEIVNDQRKFLGLADADRLVRGGVMGELDFADDARSQGFFPGDITLLRRALEFARHDAIVHQEVNAYVALLHSGEIDFNEFQTFINSLQLADDEKPFIVELGQIISSHPRKHLALADCRNALAKNIMSLDEFRTHLARLGYGDDDQTVLELLEQATLRDKADAAQQKKQIAADKAAAAVQKKADQAAASAQKKAAAAQAKADARAFTLAKQQAASAAAVARVQQTEAALVAHEQQIAQAQKDKLLTQIQADQAKATLATLKGQHQAQAANQIAQATALDAAQVSVDQAQVAAQVTAEKVAATTKAARARVALDEQLLAARQADRVAGFLLARQNEQDAFDAGEITAKQLAAKLRSIDLQEKQAIAAENLTALQTSKAQAAADAAVASGTVTLDTVAEKATLIPPLTKKRQDIAAATLAAHTALVAQTGTEQASATAAIASQRIAALDAAAAARSALDSQLAAAKIALEEQIQANKPHPPS